MKCSRCDEKSVIIQGHQHLCEKHYRFGQMRQTAKRAGKIVPSHEQLEKMVPPEMQCSDCGAPMNWRRKDGQSTVVSLQHYRDGKLALVCLSCNTRHASMIGDAYRDIPKNHKHCPSCKAVKHESEFTLDSGRSGILKRKSRCKECSNKAVNDWKEKNREQYNQYQREYRAKRKASGNPVGR